jgi:CBS domain-containing protein
MKNSIAERIADFLKTILLLNLSMLDLIAISKESQVVYLEKNQVLLTLTISHIRLFYIVKDGAVGNFL